MRFEKVYEVNWVFLWERYSIFRHSFAKGMIAQSSKLKEGIAESSKLKAEREKIAQSSKEEEKTLKLKAQS